MHFSKIAVAGLLPIALAAPVALEARYPPPQAEPDYKTIAKILLLKHLENLYPGVGGKGASYPPPAGGYPTGPAPGPAPAPAYPPAGGSSGATGGVPGGVPSLPGGVPGGLPGGLPPVYPPPVVSGGGSGATPPVYPDNSGVDSATDYPGSTTGGTPGGDLPIYPPTGVSSGSGGGSPSYPDSNSNGGDYAGDDYDDPDYGYGGDYGSSSGSKYDYRSLAKRQNQGSPAGNIIPIEVLRGGKVNILNDFLNNSLNKLTAALGLGVLGAGTATATPLNLG